MAQWINEFKIAVIEEDIDKIRELILTMPSFEKVEEMKEAFSLIGEAKKLVQKHKNQVAIEMDKIRKSKKFLETAKTEGLYEVFS